MPPKQEKINCPLLPFFWKTLSALSIFKESGHNGVMLIILSGSFLEGMWCSNSNRGEMLSIVLNSLKLQICYLKRCFFNIWCFSCCDHDGTQWFKAGERRKMAEKPSWEKLGSISPCSED